MNNFNFTNNNPDGYGKYDVYIYKSISHLSKSNPIEANNALSDVIGLENLLFGRTIYEDVFACNDDIDIDITDDDGIRFLDDDESFEDDDEKPYPSYVIEINDKTKLKDMMIKYYTILDRTTAIYNKFSDSDINIILEDIYIIDIHKAAAIAKAKPIPKNKDEHPLYRKFINESYDILQRLYNFGIHKGLVIYSQYSTYKLNVPMFPILYNSSKNN